MLYKWFFKNFPVIIILSAFGIYITGGLRVEHFILYPLAFILIFISVILKKDLIKKIFFVCIIWTSIIAIALLVTLYNGGNISSIIADLESFMQPLIITLVFSFLLNKNESSLNNIENVIIKSCKALLIMLSLNTIFTILDLFLGLSNIANYFWSGSGTSGLDTVTVPKYAHNYKLRRI